MIILWLRYPHPPTNRNKHLIQIIIDVHYYVYILSLLSTIVSSLLCYVLYHCHSMLTIQRSHICHYCESTYDILLKNENHDMLYIGCLRNMTTEILKALHGSTPIYIKDHFKGKHKIYNSRSTVSVKQPKCNTVTYGLNSFWYNGAKIWNHLPNEIKNSITLAELKKKKKNGKYQSVFAICVQECSCSKTHWNIFSLDGHVLFHNNVPKYLNQIYNLLLLGIEYNQVNSFLLIFFSFKCTLLTLNKIWFDLIWFDLMWMTLNNPCHVGVSLYCDASETSSI